MAAARPGSIRACLGGDVMTGRGIDQVLPHPGDPALHEPYVRDAREYVHLAEAAHGPAPRPVGFAYIWGDALAELRAADVRVVNLETSVTTCDGHWPGKDIHYRMHPGNIGCLTAAGFDCCELANNHVLDWGHGGLAETLRTLDAVGVAHPGAGRTPAEAAVPTVLAVPGKGRVLVFAFGDTSSGIPPEWAAGPDRPGVNLLDDLSEDTARRVADRTGGCKRPGDVVIASVHWGGNWGHDIPAEQVGFAHRLVDGGVDLVHGHSSHHAKAVEVYRGRLVLYGCGDLLNDYEGIRGHERFRRDLAVLYLADLDPGDGRLVAARLVPFQARRFRLGRAPEPDLRQLCDMLSRHGEPFGTRVEMGTEGSLALRWR